MIQYTCRKMTKEEINIYKKEKKIENFKEIPLLNIRSASTISTVDTLFQSKCPSTYHKLGDICCPVYLEKGKCPINNPKDKTRVNGMPICALNYVAANEWSKKNKSKILHLCSELPKTAPAVKRPIVNPQCNKNMVKINNKCYKPCPSGFKSDGTKCIPIEFNRTNGIETKCPKNTVKVGDRCYQECPFGYKPFDDYCVPNDLANF